VIAARVGIACLDIGCRPIGRPDRAHPQQQNGGKTGPPRHEAPPPFRDSPVSDDAHLDSSGRCADAGRGRQNRCPHAPRFHKGPTIHREIQQEGRTMTATCRLGWVCLIGSSLAGAGKTIVSGDRRITGWRQDGPQFWVADVPEVQQDVGPICWTFILGASTAAHVGCRRSSTCGNTEAQRPQRKTSHESNAAVGGGVDDGAVARAAGGAGESTVGYHHWNRAQQCPLDDHPSCPRRSPLARTGRFLGLDEHHLGGRDPA
jgi:hypothetical protein